MREKIIMELDMRTICPKCSKHIFNPGMNFCPYCGLRLSSVYCQKEEDVSLVMDEKLYSGQNMPYEKAFFAGFWIRLGAFWMDFLFVLLIGIFLWSLLNTTPLGQSLFIDGEQICLFSVLIFLFYHALSIGNSGSTFGKRFFGLKVIPQNRHLQFGYAEAFLRTLSYFISFLSLLFGFVMIALDKQKQGLHDKIARTLVIRRFKVPVAKRIIAMVVITSIVFLVFALQYNISSVYQSIYNHERNFSSRRREVVTILVTKSDIKSGVYKEINTRSGPYIIQIPRSASDGSVFKVSREREEGGDFYILIVLVEAI